MGVTKQKQKQKKPVMLTQVSSFFIKNCHQASEWLQFSTKKCKKVSDAVATVSHVDRSSSDLGDYLLLSFPPTVQKEIKHGHEQLCLLLVL